MVAITLFVKVATLTGLLTPVLASLPDNVLKREDSADDTVGTNLYNCHDNCGEAILESEIDGFCNTTIFSTDYAACLQCSGPDNEDIWQYYGPYLTAAAVECGSATVPLDGTQADVATALLAESAAATATATSTSASATTTSAGATATAATATATSSSATATTTTTSGASKQASGYLLGGLTVFLMAAVANMA